jgi:hypothetical protein
MAPSAIAQRRTHNQLLFQKLLNLRDGASPFTLLLDTLEQSAQPIVQEFMVRAKVSEKMRFMLSRLLRTLSSMPLMEVSRNTFCYIIVLWTVQIHWWWAPAKFLQLSKTKIIFISFQTLRKPEHADVFITARKNAALIQEISSHLPKPQGALSHGPTTSKTLKAQVAYQIANLTQKHFWYSIRYYRWQLPYPRSFQISSPAS